MIDARCDDKARNNKKYVNAEMAERQYSSIKVVQNDGNYCYSPKTIYVWPVILEKSG